MFLQIRMLTDFGKNYDEKNSALPPALFTQPNSPTTSTSSASLLEGDTRAPTSNSLRQAFTYGDSFSPQSSPPSSPGYSRGGSGSHLPDPPHEYSYHFDAKLIVTEEFPDDDSSSKRKWRRAIYRCTYPCVSWNARAHSWLVYYEDAEGRKSKTFNPKKLGRFYNLQPEIREFLMRLDPIEASMHQACVFAAQVRWQSKIRKHMAAVQQVGVMTPLNVGYSPSNSVLAPLHDCHTSAQLPSPKVQKVDDVKPLMAQYGLGFDNLEYTPLVKPDEAFSKEADVWDLLVVGSEVFGALLTQLPLRQHHRNR